MAFEAFIAAYLTKLLDNLAVQKQPVRIFDVREVAESASDLDEYHRLLVVLVLVVVDLHRLVESLRQNRDHLVLDRHLLHILVRLREALDRAYHVVHQFEDLIVVADDFSIDQVARQAQQKCVILHVAIHNQLA